MTMKMKKNQNVIPAQSANFQPMALFQHGMLSSNPLGIQTVPARSANFQPKAPFQHLMLSSNPLGIPARRRSRYSLESNEVRERL
jgi:hypothetical protein